MRAWLALRNDLHYRKDAFTKGLQALGYEVHPTTTEHPGPRDILVTWNRYGFNNHCAAKFEARGRPVVVAENAAWGNRFCGQQWYSLALGRHNTSGCFPVGEADRWDSLGVELGQWRTGGETVVLPQRGIGPEGVAMPRDWTRRQTGRVRPHPGKNQQAKPLDDDLANAGKVVTWGSGAAIKALILGVPVESHMPNWIGEQDNTDAGRLAMFRRLAWAQWRLEEIESGEAFRALAR